MFESLAVLMARLAATAPPATPETVWPPVLDPDGLVVSEIVELDQARSMIEARQMVLMSALADRADGWADPDSGDPYPLTGATLAAAELAPALRLSPVTAGIRVERAARIRDRLPDTLAAYSRGELDAGRVYAIDDATRHLDDEQTSAVERLVLRRAVDQTAAELRAALRKAVLVVDPDGAETRRKAAVKDRSVTHYARDDGMGVIEAVLSAVDSGEIYDLIDETARRTKTLQDTRGIAARRSDALVHLLLGRDPQLGPDDTTPPPPPPPHPHWDQPPPDPTDADTTAEPDQPQRDAPVDPTDQPEPAEPAEPAERAERVDRAQPAQSRAWARTDPGPVEPGDLDERYPPEHDGPIPGVHVGASRTERISELAALALSAMTSRRPPRPPWVALNHTNAPDGTTVTVGELQGYGPISGTWAEHLLATGAARAPDPPTGREPTPGQAHAHDPPDWLASEVKIRDGTCRFPGCRRAAHRIDLDHTIEHPEGLTVRTNLAGLCRRHHRTKQARTWTVRQQSAGIITWTSRRTGRTYSTHPRGTTGEWQGTTSHQ